MVTVSVPVRPLASRSPFSPVTVVLSLPIRIRVWLSANALASMLLMPSPLVVMMMVGASAMVTMPVSR